MYQSWFCWSDLLTCIQISSSSWSSSSKVIASLLQQKRSFQNSFNSCDYAIHCHFLLANSFLHFFFCHLFLLHLLIIGHKPSKPFPAIFLLLSVCIIPPIIWLTIQISWIILSIALSIDLGKSLFSSDFANFHVSHLYIIAGNKHSLYTLHFNRKVFYFIRRLFLLIAFHSIVIDYPILLP